MEITTRSSHAVQANVSAFMNRVYTWMALGLVLSAVSAYYIMSSPALMMGLVQNKMLFFGLIIAQIGVVLWLSFKQATLSVTAARGLYLFYTLLTGITFSVILMSFTAQSVVNTFFVTAASFAGLSLFGYVTKRDLGPVGTFCIMGLWGLIILSVLALFIPGLRSDTMQLFMGAIGVLVFSGLTAYDTQKIKMIYLNSQSNENKQAVFGALTLYLDFINLFLSMLRLMGDRR